MPRGNGARRAENGESVRQRVCEECARIMVMEGVRDFHVAKQRAGARLGLQAERNLPNNLEIDAAVRAYLNLFYANRHAADLALRFAGAGRALRDFEPFAPRAVGAMLRGWVLPTTPVELHLFADTVEEVQWYLQDAGIPFVLDSKRLRFGADRYNQVPVYRYTRDDLGYDLAVFSGRGMRETPLCPVDGRPMRRVNLRELSAVADALGVPAPPAAS